MDWGGEWEAAFGAWGVGGVAAVYAVISDSSACVTSGSAGAPSGVENLMPLYSGGLCEAVKLMAPSALDWIAAYEMAGGGGGAAKTTGGKPQIDKKLAPTSPKGSSRKRRAPPTINFSTVPFYFLCET